MLYCKNDFEKELFDLAVPRSFEKYDPERRMTKGEVLKKYGITYMSHVIPSEEADEEFEDFVRTLAENFKRIYHR